MKVGDSSVSLLCLLLSRSRDKDMSHWFLRDRWTRHAIGLIIEHSIEPFNGMAASDLSLKERNCGVPSMSLLSLLLRRRGET